MQLDFMKVYDSIRDKSPMPEDFEAQYIDGVYDSLLTQGCDEQTYSDAFENLKGEFSQRMVKQVKIDNGLAVLYRGLNGVALPSLNEQLGNHWTYDKKVAQNVYCEFGNSSVLCVHVEIERLNFAEAFDCYLGNATHEFEINTYANTRPIKVWLGEELLIASRFTMNSNNAE